MNGNETTNGSASTAVQSSLTDVFAAESGIRASITSGDVEGAAKLVRDLYGEAVAMYCTAVFGAGSHIEAAISEVWERLELELSKADAAATLRSVVLGLARRRCAILGEVVSSGNEFGPVATRGVAVDSASKPSQPELARRLLGRLRPTDRELLILRYVNRLSYEEISTIWAYNESDSQHRLSQALLRAVAASSAEESTP